MGTSPLTLTWSHIWWWWLLFVALSWLAIELDSIIVAHAEGLKNITEWTLSDTIRRWSALHRWLSPVVIGSSAFLLAHFFLQSNQ